MNHILRQIAELCDDSPDSREAGTLAEFQHRLDDYAERLTAILGYAHQLDKILSGAPHPHAAGTMEGLHIDICANCGRDIRDPIHMSQ